MKVKSKIGPIELYDVKVQIMIERMYIKETSMNERDTLPNSSISN